MLSPAQAANEHTYTSKVASILNISANRIQAVRILNRSIDARGKSVKVRLQLAVYIDERPPKNERRIPEYKNVATQSPVIIVGAGPAGLFAALKLIELGFKPIVIERGKDVHERKRDIAAIHRNQGVNPDSNYSFGEGGAGTYSDGKLYTRSKKRGNVKSILDTLYQHGADESILIDAHPHIGTNRLPGIIESIRNTIVGVGGEVHFNTALKELIIEEGKATGIVTRDGHRVEGKAVILATGHSARDVYFMLHRQGILIEAKALSMGVRVEHMQQSIDSIQYNCTSRGPYLPAASYSLVQQVEERGVYSFCMCPGGIIVPASTANNEMVVNGMSPSMRNSRWANSGMVVEIQLADLPVYPNLTTISMLEFQQHYEQLAFQNGGEGQIAPAQRMVDFAEGRISNSLPESSFYPGLQSSPMHEWMPGIIGSRLQEALKLFNRKMKGYYTNEALLIGVESRTSSPIRIPRDRETYQHPQIEGLFPCGEGAGYAGGIASSAIDGENCALALVNWLR